MRPTVRQLHQSAGVDIGNQVVWEKISLENINRLFACLDGIYDFFPFSGKRKPVHSTRLFTGIKHALNFSSGLWVLRAVGPARLSRG